MLKALRAPLVALLLGLVPFMVFVGASNTVRVNGKVVQDDQFNILGLVLAAIGLVLALRFMVATTPRSRAGIVVSALAMAACTAQIGASLGLYSPGRLIGRPPADSDLPRLTYTGLDAGNRRIPQGILARGDPVEIRNQLIGYKAITLEAGYTHLAYADRCHDGRRRLNAAVLDSLPDFLTAEERARLAADIASGRKRGKALACNPANTAHAMGELVDKVRRLNDFVSILQAGYLPSSKVTQ